MAFQTPEIKNFRGLYKQANSFTVPDGAMETVENYVLTRDGTLTKQRGFYQFYDPSALTLNNLFVYQNKLMAAYSDRLAYFTEGGTAPSLTGTATALTGRTVAITGDRVARTAQSNGNCFITTDEGLLKLEAYNSKAYTAGVPPALDLRAKFTAANGAILGETQVAWRGIFGRRDANDGLLLSAPSDIVVLTNSLVSATWTRTTNVVTVTTTSAHGLVSGMQITLPEAGSSGGGTDIPAATYTLTGAPTATTFTFAHTAANDASGNTLSYSTTRVTLLEFSVPSEIDDEDDGYFLQIYRTTQSEDSDVTPNADFKLVDEHVLTAAEISAGLVLYEDDTDDLLLGAELYTNPNSREGELQANDRPPLAEDVTIFKNHLILGNCQTRHLLDMGVVDPSSLAAADYVEVKVDSTIRRYIARTGVANQTVAATSLADNGSGKLQITYASHGLANNDSVYISNITAGTLTSGFYYVVNRAASTFEISPTIGGTAASFNSETGLDFQGAGTMETTQTSKAWVRASNVVTVTNTSHGLQVGMVIYASASSGGSPEVTTGLYTITVVPDANTFGFAETAADDASGNTLSYAAFQPMFALDTASSSASVKLRNTAQGLVKAINRDTTSEVYARYTSGISDTPGRFRLQAKGFTEAVYMRASAATPGEAFSPVLPASFSSGTQVFSRNDQLPSTWFASKIGEPEAVPFTNKFPTGAKNQELIRSVALRDVMIVLKADGIFRVTGDSVSSFNIQPLDTTIFCIAKSSVAVINNTVIFLSNQGWCRVTDSSVEIISRDFEDVVKPILGDDDIEELTGAVAYESEHLYLTSTREPLEDETSRTYIYNIFSGGWTESTTLFKHGVVGPSDTLYLITTDNKIIRERKGQTRIDYCGQNYAITVASVAADGLSATFTSADAAPEVGWVIVKEDIFSRITAVTDNGGTSYTVTFPRETNLEAADTEILYAGYLSTIKLAPFHAGLVGRMKVFSEMHVHLRSAAASELVIWFASNFFASSPYTTWEAREPLEEGGWGSGSWGFFEWGDADSINLTFGTYPAAAARVLLPRDVQRSAWVQPVIEHDQAGEPVNIQALTFAVRAYGTKVAA